MLKNKNIHCVSSNHYHACWERCATIVDRIIPLLPDPSLASNRYLALIQHIWRKQDSQVEMTLKVLVVMELLELLLLGYWGRLLISFSNTEVQCKRSKDRILLHFACSWYYNKKIDYFKASSSLSQKMVDDSFIPYSITVCCFFEISISFCCTVQS